MNASDWIALVAAIITVLAVLTAPLIALRVSKRLDRHGEKERRRIDIFRNLMATRGARTSFVHVNALNSIELDFDNHGDKAVFDAWKKYHDHLNDHTYGDDKIDDWIRKQDDLFSALLYEMAKALKYDLNEVDIKRGVYVPKKYGDDEEWNQLMRQSIKSLFKGDIALPITVHGSTSEKGEEIISKSLEYYEKALNGQITVNVNLSKSETSSHVDDKPDA